MSQDTTTRDQAHGTFAAGVAPGDHEDEAHRSGREVVNYLIGLFLATVLTLGSFWVASGPSVLYRPGLTMALAALAVAQMGVHLAFFLHITTGDDNINNVLALAFGVMIVGFVIAGTLWIMHSMDANMMMPMPAGGQPMHDMQQMQR